MSLPIKDQIVIVSGAGRGFGAAIAAAFARGLARSAQDGRVGNFWADLWRISEGSQRPSAGR